MLVSGLASASGMGTVTTIVSKFIQLVAVSVTVKIYEVVMDGNAVGFGIPALSNPITGDQLYNKVVSAT